VSRLWRDRLLVSLAPSSVALARVAGGLRPRIIAKQALDCDPAFGVESWQGAVAALATAAGRLRGERVNVTVVLSNYFVRYAIVPFDAALAGPEEELALARFHFSKVHGERAKGWEVRMSEAPHGAARLASAVDAGLIQAIRACFPREGKARLVSLRPYLMSAFNRWGGTMPKEGAWLLLVEPQRVCMALVAARKWAAVLTSRGEFPAPEDWAALLDRQQLRANIASTPHTVLVHAPAGWKSIGNQARGWNFVGLSLPRLEGFLPLEDRHFAMALTAR